MKKVGLVRVSDIVKATGMNRPQIIAMGKSGEIPGYVNVLGQHGFQPEEVEPWLEVQDKPEPEPDRAPYTVWLTKREADKLKVAGWKVKEVQD